MNEVKNLNAAEFDAAVIKNDTPTLVDFWAPWCGPCLMMAPILDELAKMSEGKFNVVKVDVENDQNKKLGMEYDIRSIPNMKLFKNGKIIHEFEGLTDAKTLKNSIINALNR